MTRKQFIKENIIVSIIWNIPLLGFVLSTTSMLDFPTYYTMFGSLIIFLMGISYSLDKWYLEHRIDELEKKLKDN